MWIKASVLGKNGWIEKARVGFHRLCEESTATPSTKLQLPGCPRIISRAEWGARAPLEENRLRRTPYYAFIHHGSTADCHTRHECIRMVQSYQNFHMDGRGWSDIAYSFLVGEDGNVYEGRGWDNMGAHTYHFNGISLGLCVVGDFMERPPNQAALNAIRNLISCAVRNRKLTPTYTLLGHRDVGSSRGSTTCPGDQYYALITKWPHFNSTVIPSEYFP